MNSQSGKQLYREQRGKRKGCSPVPTGSLHSRLASWATLKMEVILSCETSAHIRTTQRYIPQDGKFYGTLCFTAVRTAKLT
jgi:hypothetical protein